MPHVKPSVMKKALHQDLIDDYVTTEAKGRGFSLCSAFEEGEEFTLKRMTIPDKFCPWAWADTQRDVAMVLFGSGYPWVQQESTAITCCTDGL
jgi:uncharacterized repeat protein (TIGR04076 family)